MKQTRGLRLCERARIKRSSNGLSGSIENPPPAKATICRGDTFASPSFLSVSRALLDTSRKLWSKRTLRRSVGTFALTVSMNRRLSRWETKKKELGILASMKGILLSLSLLLLFTFCKSSQIEGKHLNPDRSENVTHEEAARTPASAWNPADTNDPSNAVAEARVEAVRLRHPELNKLLGAVGTSTGLDDKDRMVIFVGINDTDPTSGAATMMAARKQAPTSVEGVPVVLDSAGAVFIPGRPATISKSRSSVTAKVARCASFDTSMIMRDSRGGEIT